MLSDVMLSDIKLSDIMLRVIVLSVVMLSVVMLTVVILSVVMLSVVMLSDVAPGQTLTYWVHKYGAEKSLVKKVPPRLANIQGNWLLYKTLIFKLRAQKLTGETQKFVWVKFSTLSLAVFVMSVIAWHRQARPHL